MKTAPKSAAKIIILENSHPIHAETEAIQSQIRQRAFEISQTRPADAHALYDWMAAESEVVSVPPMELLEREGRFELKFAVAGVDPYSINVLVAPEQILLKSVDNHQHDSEIGTVHVCDFKSTLVFRSAILPEPVDVNTVTVDYYDG